MTDTKKPTLSEIHDKLVTEDISYLLHLIERVGKALGWSLKEIDSSTEFHEGESIPIHGCEYIWNPESGKCDFHDGYSDARALLEELKK